MEVPMEISHSSPVAKQHKTRRARTSSRSQSPLASISGLGACRSPGLSLSFDSGYDSDSCSSLRDSPPKLYTSDTHPNTVKLPPPPPQEGSTSQSTTTCVQASTNTTSADTSSNHNLQKLVERRRRRKFRKSQSDQLLRTVLKRAQRKVNKRLSIKSKSSSPTKVQQQQQHKSSSKSTIDGVNPADYKDLKYVAPASVEKLVNKSSTSGSQQFVLIDSRTPGEFRTEHVHGAVNIFNKEAMFMFYSMQLTVAAKDLPSALIFYSNHVINESLKMAYFLRALDLRTNNSRHSKLLFPKIYIINENFNSFRTQLSGIIESNSQ